MRYFMLIPRDRFERLGGVLRQCRRERSFRPAAEVCLALAQVAHEFIQRDRGEVIEPLTLTVPEGLTYSPESWSLLAGELLILSAAELPEIETPLETFAAVMGVELAQKRGGFPPIQQAVEGSRDLWLGACYRPEHVGWNDLDDVRRLAEGLAGIEVSGWDAMNLTAIPSEQREDELAFAREWLPPLAAMYRRAADGNQVVVCEEI